MPGLANFQRPQQLFSIIDRVVVDHSRYSVLKQHTSQARRELARPTQTTISTNSYTNYQLNNTYVGRSD